MGHTYYRENPASRVCPFPNRATNPNQDETSAGITVAVCSNRPCTNLPNWPLPKASARYVQCLLYLISNNVKAAATVGDVNSAVTARGVKVAAAAGGVEAAAAAVDVEAAAAAEGVEVATAAGGVEAAPAAGGVEAALAAECVEAAPAAEDVEAVAAAVGYRL